MEGIWLGSEEFQTSFNCRSLEKLTFVSFTLYASFLDAWPELRCERWILVYDVFQEAPLVTLSNAQYVCLRDNFALFGCISFSRLFSSAFSDRNMGIEMLYFWSRHILRSHICCCCWQPFFQETTLNLSFIIPSESTLHSNILKMPLILW